MTIDSDGYEVRRTKAANFWIDANRIFLTARSEQKDIIRGFEAGAVDYLTKPFNGKELLTRVKTHLDLKRTRDELRLSLQTKRVPKVFSILRSMPPA